MLRLQAKTDVDRMRAGELELLAHVDERRRLRAATGGGGERDEHENPGAPG